LVSFGNPACDQLVSALVAREILDAGDVERLQALEPGNIHDLERTLTDSFGVTAGQLLLTLAEHAQIPVICLSGFVPHEDLIKLVPREILIRNRALPLARTQRTLTLAIADPLNLLAVEEVGERTGLSVMAVAALEQEILELLQGSDTSSQRALSDILQQANSDTSVEVSREAAADNIDIDQVMESAEDAPVVRIVNIILVEAMRRRASDIHIEPFERELRLRYRVDGVLEEGPAPPKSLQYAIASRIKVMAELDIAERRIPQDGRFRIKAQGREVDLRVSILPTVHGEKIVLRLLDKTNLAKNLDSLGLDPDSLRKLRHAVNQPHGLILVTGPTGSGKTTTLYSALQELNTPDVNIITVENPVEYQLDGINQVEIHDKVNMTFAAALRSILRQDPDIVLVGETRDAETASTAVKAALTGHLVMTTLHTNDAPGAIARLIQMGIEPFLLASSLLLAQAQRLVRRICPNCREPYELDPVYAEANGIDPALFAGATLYRGRGCSRCGHSGYKGRASIMEVLLVSSAIRELILRSATVGEIIQQADKEGFRDLRANGFFRVKEGVTTIEEVLRVTAGEV
jgi:type IV pilus assembly protein PilB